MIEASIENDIAAVAQIAVVKKILEVICRTTGMGFSAVARVTDSHWIACAVQDEINFGLKPGGELELRTTICHEIRQSGNAVVIDHVACDPAFRDHHTPKQYGFQSYISVPIRLTDGKFFGTLCAIDPRPAKVNTPEMLGMFSLFADLIAQHLDAQQRMQASETALVQERKIAGFRDQFMAVLGHDLRNPLNAIVSAAELLGMVDQSEDVAEAVAIIQRSSTRMAELIDNVLDFARTAMGGGLALRRVASPTLGKTLSHVIHELRVAWPGRVVREDISLAETVSCDAARIGQVLSNLLANALTHGSAHDPVIVDAHSSGDGFELSVTNAGATIPVEKLPPLFQPFVRGKARPGAQGLGLGLYIASEIARAHDGTLTAVSANDQTRFTLRIPLG